MTRRGQEECVLRLAALAQDDGGRILLVSQVSKARSPPHERGPVLTPAKKTCCRGHRAFVGTPDLHPTDEDLSVGTPDLGHP